MQGWVERIAVLSGAFAFALLFWAYVRLSQTYVTELRIPLRVELPAELALRTMPPPVLAVHVQGTGWQLLALEIWHRPRGAVLTVPEFHEAALFGVGREHLLRLLSLPAAVTPLHIVPDTLTLHLERAHVRRLPVVPALRIELPPGFLVAQLRFEPESVTVRGAQEALASLGAVFPAETRLVPADWEFTRELPVMVPSSLPVRLEPERIRLSVRIQPEAEGVLEGIPVELSPAFLVRGHVFFPQRVRLWVRGPLERIVALSPRELRVSIPAVELLRDTTGVLVPQVQAPEGIEVFRIEPPFLFHWQQE
ncbi:hypothetical protein HRbin21_00532 [bacterium HR21]|nr:hypothetical protein HRbin21_00532 [bacterium HR21]